MKRMLFNALVCLLAANAHALPFSKINSTVQTDDVAQAIEADFEAETQAVEGAFAQLFGNGNQQAENDNAQNEAYMQLLLNSTPSQLHRFLEQKQLAEAEEDSEETAEDLGLTPNIQQMIEPAATEDGLVIEVNSFRPPLKTTIDGAQTLIALENGQVTRGPWPVSTGAILKDKKTGKLKDHATPVGTYPALALIPDAHSAKYENADMPNAIFWKKAGKSLAYAVHGVPAREERLLGHAASHGCVRLSLKNSADLYQLAESYGVGRVTVHVYR